MVRPLAQIEQEIRNLSAPEQEALLRALWEELDGPPDVAAEAAWLEEVTPEFHPAAQEELAAAVRIGELRAALDTAQVTSTLRSAGEA